MKIQNLNAEYGIGNQVTFIEGQGALPFIKVNTSKASALISIYGGQVLSFKPAANTEDLLFLSNKAYFQQGKAIKGGIPICWPWFGADHESRGRPAHGFARTSMWHVASTTFSNDEAQITLTLGDSTESRALWPQHFNLSLEITIGGTLSLNLITRNLGNEAFSITQALHTYFNVGGIECVTISGLDGVNYLDKVDGGKQKKQTETLAITEEVDRIYTDVKNELIIEDEVLNRRISINNSGSKTAVVWNPWAKICAASADLDDADYQRFVCVETANAAEDIIAIEAGGEHRLKANYSLQNSA